MVDFRKILLLLVVLLTASSMAVAQQQGAFSCVATGGVPPIVRAEGLAEYVGDVILNCTGGTPTPIGTTVPLINFRVLLNTNVTSALLSGSGIGGWTESILAIDDPVNPNVNPLRGPATPTSPNYGDADFLRGTGWPTGINYAVPNAPENRTGAGQTNSDAEVYNVFQGQYVGANEIEWRGVPIDPPGSTSVRIIRITNVRANANAFGVSGTFVPAQLTMFVSATGTFGVPINNPTQVVAIVQDGMTFDVVGNPNYLQCVSNPKANSVCDYDFLLRFKENFPTAFKHQGPAGNSDVFGLAIDVNTESNYYNDPGILSPVFGNYSGLASQGTRLFARFKNLQSGVTVRVWRLDKSTNCTDRAQSTDPESTIPAVWVNGASSTTGGGGTLSGAAAWTDGVSAATWEIVPNAANDRDLYLDQAIFAVDLVWTSNTTAGIPGLGTSVVAGSYAPLSTATSASPWSTTPHPRFIDDSTDENTFTINSCSTSLLWPYITNQVGFDTGMVISNTSKDPFAGVIGNHEQKGPCTVYYYGFTTGGGPAPAPVTIPEVQAGEQAVWTLSSGGQVNTSGGAIPPAPGFQGYAIAICQFQYAHGYAFISDIGASKLAQGYLALVIDAPFWTLPRSGSLSEPLNQ